MSNEVNICLADESIRQVRNIAVASLDRLAYPVHNEMKDLQVEIENLSHPIGGCNAQRTDLSCVPRHGWDTRAE